MHSLKNGLILSLMFYANNTWAEIDLQRLKQLFDSGNSQQAYEYALTEIVNAEGEPVFDYYYGTSAIDVGQANEGVYALERVLLSQPNNKAARLELARGYFILQEYDRARAEFNTALKHNPPDDVREKIYAYLDNIRLQEKRYKTTSTAYIELSYGRDTNVNSGPDNPVITFLGQTGELNPSALEQQDSFAAIEGNYGISTPLTPRVLFNASINASLNKNKELSEFDAATYTGFADIRFLQAQDTYSIGLIAQQFSIDDNSYRQLAGINSQWSRNLSQLFTLQTFLQLSRQRFNDQKARDVHTGTLGTGFTRRINAPLSPVIYSSLYVAQDMPVEDTDIARQIAERDYYGVRLGTVLTTSARTSLQLSVNYQSSKYGLEDFNGIRREDDHIDTQLDFTWLLSRHWSLHGSAVFIKNDSNNSLNTYERKLGRISLRYEMK